MLRKKKIIFLKRAARKRKACLPGRQGQSTVEYIILVAAVIGAAIVFSGTFKTNFQDTVDSVGEQMKNMAGRLNASRP